MSLAREWVREDLVLLSEKAIVRVPKFFPSGFSSIIWWALVTSVVPQRFWTYCCELKISHILMSVHLRIQGMAATSIDWSKLSCKHYPGGTEDSLASRGLFCKEMWLCLFFFPCICQNSLQSQREQGYPADISVTIRASLKSLFWHWRESFIIMHHCKLHQGGSSSLPSSLSVSSRNVAAEAHQGRGWQGVEDAVSLAASD